MNKGEQEAMIVEVCGKLQTAKSRSARHVHGMVQFVYKVGGGRNGRVFHSDSEGVPFACLCTLA